MQSQHQQAPSSGPDRFDWRTRRLVEHFSIGWAILLLLGPIPVHFIGTPEVPYWRNMAAVAAHVIGAFAVLAWFLAHRGWAALGARVLTAALFIGIWIGVIWASETPYVHVGAFFFISAPLVAGILLDAREAAWLGFGQVPMIGVAGWLGVFPLVTAATSALAVAGVTTSIAISAWLREQDHDRIMEQQDRLTDTNLRLRSVVDVTTDGIVQVDEQGQMVLWNPAAITLLHLEAAQVKTGASLAQVLPMDVQQAVRLILAANSLGRAESTEGHWRGATVRLESVPLPRGSLLVVTDFTQERRKAEKKHALMAHTLEIEKLQEINEFKTRLLNTASHELNTPLTPMRLQLELLKSASRGPLNEKQLRSIEILDRNARRMEGLVRDILDVARMESDRLRIRRDPVALGTMIIDEVVAFEAAALRKDLHIMVDVEDVWVPADTRRLAQTLQNLLANAIKFTPTGGTITITCQREGDQARVMVRDTGIGIPEDHLHELFTPFSQFHEESRAYGGTGLGLYICKGIVEAHGGAIGCQSEGEGMGATFWFTLPVIETEELGPSALVETVTD